MRVLLVDADLTCLKILEILLRKCHYHVTVMSQAREALQLLRENRDRFDLVISDVHMPDMDSFKLLELVGLEMDLPVIMLSANGDPKLVMKGITHGACDFLVKPVRIEELRNIWQHVVRRKTFDSNRQKNSNDEIKATQTSRQGHLSSVTLNADQNMKFSRKRKDDEDEIEDKNEDPATEKKPGGVWSVELHQKFVAAVNQLGIEKAVPKRILGMMNVEGLTRENVASHLQKYRFYLKRIRASRDGLGDFLTFGGSGRLANTALSPLSAIIQPNQTQDLSNSSTSLGKIHPVISPGSQNTGRVGDSSLNVDVSDSSNFLDQGKFNEKWQITIQMPKLQSDSLLSTEPLLGQPHLNTVRHNNSPNGPRLPNKYVLFMLTCLALITIFLIVFMYS